MIPERLGVSPAILDAVIFCHQDESLWPLSEPAALKKRFDEIFEAQKYTKAIDNLKVLRKKHVEQLGKLQNDEAHNKVNKDRGERAEKRMTGLQAEIEGAREKCETLTAEMEKTQGLAREKHDQANSYLQIVQNLGNKKDQLEYRQYAANELRSTIEELVEDDASLESSLKQYKERMGHLEEESKQNSIQYKELQNELDEAQKSLNSKLSEQGRHQSDQDKYQRQLKSRVELIHETAEKYNVRGFDGDLGDAQIRAFSEKLQKLLGDKNRDLERLQKENTSEIDKADAVITKLEGRKAAKTQDRVSAKQRMGAIEKRINQLQNESSQINVDEGAKALLDEQLEELGTRLTRLQQEFEKSNWDRQLSEENEKLVQLEAETEKLGRELIDCTRLASERAQLDYRKKELVDRKRKLETLTNTWKPKLDALLGDDWAPESLDKSFQSVSSRQTKSLEAARKAREQSRQKQQKVEYRLRNAKDVVEQKNKESTKCQQTVVAALQTVRDGAIIEEYNEELSSLESSVEEYRNELSLFDALVQYYEKCKKTLNSKKTCQLCERRFDESQRVSIERLQAKIEKNLNPNGKSETEKDLEEANSSLERLRSVRSAFDTYERICADLPGLREESKAIESEYEAADRHLEEQDALMASEEEKQRDFDDMSKTVASITQVVKDIEDSETQVERIMSQQASSGSTRSADEIHELQASIGEQLRGVKSRITKLTSDRQRNKDQISNAELERSELRNKASATSAQLVRKKDLQDQIQANKDEQVQQREAIQRADAELETIEPEMVEAKAARDEIRSRGHAKEQTARDTRDEVTGSISDIKKIDRDIQDYIDRGGPSNLASNQRAIAGLEKSISNTKHEVDELTKRNNKLRTDIDNGDRKKKNITDNLNYRKHLRALDTLKQDIEELTDRNAHEDEERLRAEAQQLENHSNRLLAERGSVMGTMKTKDEELGRLLQEWELDYKDAKAKYRESHIRVETTKAAIEDLAQCSSAVDKAVMQFHSMKMAEVNRIAGELWQSTYQGTDIDTILIRSDNESSTGKRNYNYRLCMVKQDTEMDMRGRCSAGQKVLASIIIRLALAESFGVNCGLIALDEPTTNLDRDNIKSLAESLHMIIKARQAQSNFQLIVITHDEEFLRHMRCSDFCDSFFRVKRDENQNSVISRESITKIF
jgi:DNA repair protein RAD50